MNLALFDLDHTLLPIDSDYEWSRHLVAAGAVDSARFAADNERFYRQYQAGTLDIAEFLAFQLAPLAALPRETLDALHARFMAEVVAPAIRPAARALVDRHRDAGDLCAIVTATNEYVTGPIARAFGIDHLIATRVEGIDGRITGASPGTPSFREGKVTRVGEWLGNLGHDWRDVDRSTFYSDSINDLALLERVDAPVAANPDPRLAAIARERGWPILKLFE
jgi:HAD superfamily hydrolase (TIGR01490 family)